MHWELAPAFTTADRDMATSAPMGLKDAPVAGKQSLELLCIHEYILLHTSVEVYISVERPPRINGTRGSESQTVLLPPAMPRSTSTAILSRLPEPLSAHLFAGAKSCHLRAGDALFAAGDSGDGCYRQERGLLKVIRARKREQGLEAIGSGAV
jgi:hypothetical protein